MPDNYRLRKKTDHLEVDVVGDRDFVVEQFERLWETPQALPEGEGETTLPSALDMSMGEYVNALSPSSNTEVALGIAGYLFHDRGMADFVTQDIRDGFREVLRPVPVNPSQTLAELVKQGYVMKRKKSEGILTYSVTQSGLRHLDEGF